MLDDCADILVSVEEKYVESILTGAKKVELRRRVPRVTGAKRMWIYCKAPVAAVTAVAALDGIEAMDPTRLWKKYKETLNLELQDFRSYVAGRDEVAALKLGLVRAVNPVSLRDLRLLSPNFHPPQFYLRLEPASALMRRLERSIATAPS